MTEALQVKPHIMIVSAPFYKDIAAQLLKGAQDALTRAGASHELFEVPGALEIPAAILSGIKRKQFRPAHRRFDGYVALGCIIKGETYHFEVVCNESARGLMELTTQYALALGNGILTTYTEEQARARAALTGENKGAAAAQTCLDMLMVKQRLGLFPRE